MSKQMIELIGQIADMKTIDYRNTLAISTLVELLIEKGLFTREEFNHRSAELEGDTMAEIILKRRMKSY